MYVYTYVRMYVHVSIAELRMRELWVGGDLWGA